MEVFGEIILALLELALVGTIITAGVTYLAGRAALRGGKKLLGWARNQKRLPGTPQNPSREAQDVVVETIDGQPDPLRSTVKRDSYVRLDPDGGHTSSDIAKVARRYVDDPVVGTYAQATIDVLDSAEMRRQSLFTELDSTFQRGSISWDKFAAPSYAALDAILRNSALLINRIQSFDTAAYLRLQKSMGTEWRRLDNLDSQSSQTREQRWNLFKSTLASFDSILETNEGLLLELDKLASELVTLTASSPTEDSDRIIEEIRRLVEEAKYYK